MLNYLENFSQPFTIAIMLWPFLALLLTFPILLFEYIRFHRLPKGHVIVIYLLMLYLLGLVAFTLYPLPSDLATFCNTHHIQPQLNPFQFFGDILNSGTTAILQLISNLVLFIPLGIALRNLFGLKFLPTLIIAIAASLTIETAQLTGIFGIYPCAYRLFDVDDIIINTLGACLGFALAHILPNWSKPAKREKINTAPGAIHRLVTFTGDYFLSTITTLILTLPFHFSTTDWQTWHTIFTIACFITFHFLIPLLHKGQTVFGKLTGISLDDKNRRPLHRILFYTARLALLAGIVSENSLASIILIPITIIWWLIRKKLPYEIIDLLFPNAPPAP